MTEGTQFVVEVRFAHLHAVGRDLDILPETWSDALYELLPDGPIRSVHWDIKGARDVACLLRDVAGIPEDDIRITRVIRTTVPIDEPADASASADTSDELRLYRWRSEALKNYGYGHAFAVGRSINDARSAAMTSFKAYLSSDEWWGNGPDAEGNFRFEEDREDYEAEISKFQRDLDADPIAVGEAFVVRGSE